MPCHGLKNDFVSDFKDHTAFPDFLTSTAEGKMMKTAEMYITMLI